MTNKVTRRHYIIDVSLQGPQTNPTYVIFTPDTPNGWIYEPRDLLSEEDVEVTLFERRRNSARKKL